jgi:hypothetical protein
MAAIRARVRTRLEETTAAVWSDDELDECITQALETYGRRFQIETISTSAVGSGATTAALPPGALDLRRLTLDDGTVIPRRQAPRGAPSGEEQAWELFAGTIHFVHPLDAGTLTLWHTSAPSLTDVPTSDDGLIVLAATTLALESRAIQDFKRGGPPNYAVWDGVISQLRDELHGELRQRGRRVRGGVVG